MQLLPFQLYVNSSSAQNDGTYLTSEFNYHRNKIDYTQDGCIHVTPQIHNYTFRTQLKPQRTGLMLVGFGGNNASTLLGSILANKHNLTWTTRQGEQKANYYGSITQSTTIHIGWDGEKQVYVPFNKILPMVEPNDLIIDGWDINNANLYEAMRRAKVFEPELQEKLRPYMEGIIPKPSIYYPDFIASNQETRANNIIRASSKQQYVQQIRNDIRQFKQHNNLECVVVLWTASTERYVDVREGLNMNADEILSSIARNDNEISPSNLFAVAAILEGAHYINGSPQNTLVPGIIDLAERHKVFVGGDDFKSGQTKLKSALVDFLVKSGLKPESIVSYNHLGNNDGKNLSEQRQFRSKEISKSSVVDDMVAANKILYPEGNKPDHVIVIKYVPFVGDSKRAMDEYICSIFMGGHQTFAIHNTCEDSLLAAPLIIDLTLIAELASRIQYKTTAMSTYSHMHSVLSILSVLLKAPVVPPKTPVTNAFMKQLSAITKLLCAAAGITIDSDLQLEFFTNLPSAKEHKTEASNDTNGI
uniref:Inositol-3-phosphate synthase n=1 Tax=Ascaris lumbricoides TaxID=6252 RepID=A0A0M3HSW5_ASCLU